MLQNNFQREVVPLHGSCLKHAAQHAAATRARGRLTGPSRAAFGRDVPESLLARIIRRWHVRVQDKLEQKAVKGSGLFLWSTSGPERAFEAESLETAIQSALDNIAAIHVPVREVLLTTESISA